MVLNLLVALFFYNIILKLKIALITDGIAPYVIGGMQKHSYYLAKYFAKHQVYVDLIHYNDSQFNIDALEVFSVEEKKYIHSIVIHFPSSIKFPGHYLYNSYQYACLAFEYIKPHLSEYDFIYTKGFSGWKLIQEKKLGNITCCSIGVNFHGYEMFQYAPELKSKLQQQILKPFVKSISQKADVVFSYGSNISRIIEGIGVSKKNIIEIPSGVEKEIINASISVHSEPQTKFVFLGRAERRKGIIELNKALHYLTEHSFNFTFEFIGPIPEHLKITHPQITYHDEIRDKQLIKQLLEKTDVLVCPSWSEGFPNVILEAMACGLAIIATNVGAISDMVSSTNGWLIEPFNQQQLQEAMTQALAKDNLLSKKQQSLQLMSQTFNWDIISAQLINEISHLH